MESSLSELEVLKVEERRTIAGRSKDKKHDSIHGLSDDRKMQFSVNITIVITAAETLFW